MIVLRLQGGLGNQMYQYAAARQLAENRSTKLMLDLSWYQEAAQVDGVGRREYELGPLAIEEHIFQRTFLNRLRLKAGSGRLYTDEDAPYVFHQEVLDLPDNSQLFGYFQNHRYFEGIRKILLKEFALKDPPTGKNKQLLAEIMANPNAVSAHVRRGDYATSATHSAHHGLKGPEYYVKAAQLIKKTVPKPHFYVFSDDPEWCKANIKLDAPTTYIDHNSYGGDDMRLMKACKHHIIANSSFSWWGAWLNPSQTKVVIAPKQWLNDDSMDTSDVVPASWIKI